MKRLLLIGAIAFMYCLVAGAQNTTPSASTDPASKEDVQKLFEAMQIKKEMTQVVKSLVQQQRTMVHETLKRNDPTITAERLANYDQMMDGVLKEMPVEGILADQVPIYQKHFSKADIDAMTAFYASPTGQKVMREMPQLTSESMQASYARMQKQMDATIQKIKKAAAEDQARRKPSAPADAPSQ